MNHSIVRQLAAIVVLVGASLGLSTVGSASVRSHARNPHSLSSGIYRGVGSGLSNFSFKVSAGRVTGLTGDIDEVCSYLGGFATMVLLDTHAINVNQSGSFSDISTTEASSKLIITTVAGKIDSSGHAAGTVRMKTSTCDSGTVKWAATKPGVAPISTSSGNCSPGPCGIQDGLVLYVVRAQIIPSANNGGTQNSDYNSGGVDVTFRLKNKSSSTLSFASSGDYAMQAGNNAELFDYNGASPFGVQNHCPDIGVITLDPGSSSQPQHLCFPFDFLSEKNAPLTLKFMASGSPNPLSRVKIGVVHAVETTFWK